MFVTNEKKPIVRERLMAQERNEIASAQSLQDEGGEGSQHMGKNKSLKEKQTSII